jgi:hypothetical protein
LVNNLATSGNRSRTIIAYKQAAGTEGGTNLTFTSTNNEQFAWAAYSITGWDTTTAPEISSHTLSANPPSLNPSGWDVEDTLWVAVLSLDPAWAFATAGPASYTNFIEGHNGDAGGNTGVCAALATRENAAASEDPGTFTITGGDPSSWTLAVRPTSAPPVVPGGGLDPRKRQARGYGRMPLRERSWF